MARGFSIGAYLEVDSSPVTSQPLTLAGWARAPDVTTHHIPLIAVVDKDAADHIVRVDFRGDRAGDPVSVFINGDGGPAIDDLNTTTGYSANTWHHLCVVSGSGTSHAVYLDGGGKATSSGTANLANLDRVSIGRIGDSTPFDSYDGEAADCAIWNVALTDAEVLELAARRSPLSVRSDKLVFYSRMIRDEDVDIVGQLSLTPTGSPTIAEHPRIIRPAAPYIVAVPAAVAFVPYPNPRYALTAGMQPMSAGV